MDAGELSILCLGCYRHQSTKSLRPSPTGQYVYDHSGNSRLHNFNNELVKVVSSPFRVLLFYVGYCGITKKRVTKGFESLCPRWSKFMWDQDRRNGIEAGEIIVFRTYEIIVLKIRNHISTELPISIFTYFAIVHGLWNVRSTIVYWITIHNSLPQENRFHRLNALNSRWATTDWPQ